MTSYGAPSVVYPNSDIILLTQDGIQLHLHKAVLRESSQAFRSMLSIPETTSDNGPIPVPIDEAAAAFMHLVSHMYPSDSQLTTEQFDSLEEAIAILDLARKYECPAFEASMLSAVETQLDAESNPIRKWAIASHYNLAAAKNAAMLAYYESDVDYRETLGAIRELDHVTGKDLTELMDTRRRLQSVAYGLTPQYAFDESSCQECYGIMEWTAVNPEVAMEDPAFTPSDIWRRCVKIEDTYSEWVIQVRFLESCVAQANCRTCKDKVDEDSWRHLAYVRDHLRSLIPELHALRPPGQPNASAFFFPMGPLEPPEI